MNPDLSLIFSICTLVTDQGKDTQMRRSFKNHGFNSKNNEFLHIDNTIANTHDG